ncbi:hypothetical protein GH714_017531 [Hevea brasiliensis]|uniref:Uncharacterized protein n=1 Tax=Hevea brasiliensis TaxID=3981 RepID=A0A6A6N613_HEVBR|nr:hypothetical protein GH714_017531 [Hevea brasiliensis]
MHGLWTSSNQLGSGEQIQRVLNELAEVNSADIEKPRHDDKGGVTCNSIFLYAKCCKKLVGKFYRLGRVCHKLYCKMFYAGFCGQSGLVIPMDELLPGHVYACFNYENSIYYPKASLQTECRRTFNRFQVLSMSAKSHLSLCDSPILIDDGRKSFALEIWTGRKCYMLSTSDLTITWSNSPDYRRWVPDPDSRFSEVAELIDVCWFEINGEISIHMLSPETSYAAYLVFKLTTSAYGFEGHPAEITVELAGSEKDKRSVFLVPVRGQRRQHQTLRRLTGLFNCSRVRNPLCLPEKAMANTRKRE